MNVRLDVIDGEMSPEAFDDILPSDAFPLCRIRLSDKSGNISYYSRTGIISQPNVFISDFKNDTKININYKYILIKQSPKILVIF